MNIVNFELTLCDAFAKGMISNVDMFDPSVERSVLSKDDSTIVITHKG